MLHVAGKAFAELLIWTSYSYFWTSLLNFLLENNIHVDLVYQV